MFKLSVKTLSAQDRHWRNSRRNHREHSNVKAQVSRLITLALTTKPCVHIYLMKKLYISRHISQPWTDFCKDYYSLIVQVEYQGQTKYTRILVNLLSKHIFSCCAITWIDKEWSWNFFSLHIFCSMLIKQLIGLRKVRNANLKCRKDLLNQVMEGLSVKQITQKSLSRKLKLQCQVNAGLYVAFRHCVSFTTDSAANVGCNQFRIVPEILFKLCALSSESLSLP